jgi:hypothetical protein
LFICRLVLASGEVNAAIDCGLLNSGAEERIPARGAPLFFEIYGKTQLAETQEKMATVFCRVEFCQ